MRCRTLFVVSAGVAFAATTVSAGDAKPVSPVKAKDEDKEETVILSPFQVNGGGSMNYTTSTTIAGTRLRLGATPGGFKDINFGRNLLEWGMLPHVSEITAEGLFSEFDLPTPDAEKTDRPLSITGDAKAASILNQPEVTHLAQIGFSSGLDARAWRRDPVFLVVVADVSGSMSDNLPLLKASITTMLSKLGPDDAFALVSFSDDVKLDRAPERVLPAVAPTLAAAVDGLAIRGGTNIEAGLQLGLSVAQTKVAGFAGRTRVVLITDALPNIGATTPGSFMAMAEAASIAGTGLTTIGVGLDFSAEFVKKVSAVSGGNAFYFADAGQMQKKLSEDFDFMVTELAFDIEIRVDPAPGFRLVDVYGLPGDVYTRTPEGGLLLDLATLFLSRERGAIFLSFATDRPARKGTVLGRASLSYALYGAIAPERSVFDLHVRSEKDAGIGIIRGELLINEYEALRVASAAFYETGNLRTAHAQAEALVELFAAESDPAFEKELTLLENVASFLDFAVETPVLDRRALRAKPEASPLVGIWRFEEVDAPSRYLILSPAGKAALIDGPNAASVIMHRWNGKHLSSDNASSAALGIKDERLVFRSANRAADETAVWHLVRCSATEAWKVAAATAAEVSADEDEDVTLGCAFSIDADADDATAYVASDSLVETGRRVELRDIGAAIQVVTAEELTAVTVLDTSVTESEEAGESHGLR